MRNIKKKNSRTHQVIITSPIELKKYSRNSKKIIITGEWCNENLELEKLKKKFQFIKYPFENKKIKEKSYFKIIQIYNFFLLEIVSFLNKQHNVKYLSSYWEQIIGVWLLEFLIVSYEKFLIIKKIKNSSKIEINKIDEEPEIALNTLHASNLMNRHQFNNELFCYLTSNLKKKIEIVNFKSEKIKKFEKNQKGNFSLKLFLKKKIINFISLVSMILRKKKEIFIINPYLSFLNEIYLQFKVNGLFKINSVQSFVNHSKLNSKRFSFKEKKNSSFVNIIRPILFKNIPKSFLEDYKEIIRFSEKLPWAKEPQKIFTSASNFYDDTFKIWCAEKRKNYNSKLIFCCHGGGFQTWSYSSQNYLLEKTCDKILVWGKNKYKNNKVKTFFNIISSSKPFKKIKNYNEKNLKILIPQDMPAMYTNDLFSSKLHFSEYRHFVNRQKIFLSRLNNDLREKVVIRLGSSNSRGSNNDLTNYEKYMWNLEFEKINYETRDISIHESVKRSYIVIITQVSSTTLLECVTSNIPFLIFADLKKQDINNDFKKILNNLKKNKIFFNSPSDLSNFLNKNNASNIYHWWQSKKIQKIINNLSQSLAIYENNPTERFAKELKLSF